MRKVNRKGSNRKIDIILEQYTYSNSGESNAFNNWVCIPLITFGFFGLIWSIPFPYLSFLGKFNGFVNWASFLVAFTIYYYYRISPTLSYGMLLIVGLFSYCIVQLEYWEIAGGPSLWLVCLLIFVVSWFVQFIANKIGTKTLSFSTYFSSLLVGPIWLLSKLYRKLNIPY